MISEIITGNSSSGIFTEAILFFTVFGTMSIISIIISRKNAKEYETEHSLKERKDIREKRELIDKFINTSKVKIKGKSKILSDFSKLLKDKTINKKEFKILKQELGSL